MKLKNAAPADGLQWAQHPGSDDRGNGIRRIVKTVDEIENQANADDQDDQRQRGH
ncbi:MAG TPA: hypothetical protein VMT32_14310 [Bryobacteraceae bacterium]|nr:hypothetical protein [Bryobacteraceae bacterium]